MPYVNPKTYLTTLDAFLAHWEAVNAALAPSNLTLSGGYGRPELHAARAEVGARATLVVQKENVREGLSSERDQRRKALHARIGQFRRLVAALMPGSPFEKTLPKRPILSAGRNAWETALTETAALWADIEAAPPPGVPVPLLVAGGYGLADFSADAAALRKVFTALGGAEQDFALAIASRDEAWKAAYSRLVQYRLAVSAYFPLDHAMVQSLPRLSAPYKRRVKVSEPPESALL